MSSTRSIGLADALSGVPDAVLLADDHKIPVVGLLNLAGQLHDELGAWSPGQCGLVWVAASAPHVLTALAALSPQHACVPVSAGLTAAEYDRLAGVCLPDLVLLDAPTSAVARWAGGRNLPIHDLTGQVPSTWPRPTGERSPDALAGSAGMGFFTSGTTGLPKYVGFAIEQVVAAASSVAASLQLGPSDIALSMSPSHHTLGLVTNLLAPLLSGGRVVLAEPTDVDRLLRCLDRYPPTWCATTPTLLGHLRRIVDDRRVAMPALRLLRSSAAPLRQSVRRELTRTFGVPVLNAYAMTEAPGEIAAQRLAGRSQTAGSVGLPSLCDVAIIDGEVVVRGPNVARHRSDSDDWLHTSDLGFLTEAGELVLRGRKDEIFNCGGEKVMPGEIEAVAESLPGVLEVVAFPMPDERYGERPGLAVVLQDDRLSCRAIRKHMLTQLSPVKVPAAIVQISTIPTTPQGKVRRRDLYDWLRSRCLPGEEG